jgi:glycosyltransferase involved in cell wall biosynthesis
VLASRLGVADRIEFVGFTGDLAGEYSRAAFVAFPSTLEGFPLAILEAAKFALPAVAQSSLPGVGDIVRDGETGFVTCPSPASYAEGLARMMADPCLRSSLGERARSRCDGEYSKERVLAAWEEMVGEL